MFASPGAVIAKMVVQAQLPSDIAHVVMPILPRKINPTCRLAVEDRIQAARIQPILKMMVAVALWPYAGELVPDSRGILPS